MKVLVLGKLFLLIAESLDIRPSFGPADRCTQVDDDHGSADDASSSPFVDRSDHQSVKNYRGL